MRVAEKASAAASPGRIAEVDDGMMWHEVGEILDRCDPEGDGDAGDVAFDVDLACDFADELLSLHTSFCGGTPESDIPARLLAAQRRATVALASMLLELGLRYPSWTSRLLDMIDERRDLTALNADTLKGSFPEVDGGEVTHDS